MGGFAFPTYSGGGSSSGSGLTTEPISGDSLTQYLRSLTNFGGTAGTGTFQTGQSLMNQPINFWQNLMGNRTAAMGALTPAVTALQDQTQNAKRQADQFAPMGGGRANVMAQLPYNTAGQISNMIAGLQQQAAGNLASTGLSEQQVGLNALQQALSALMQRRGQNIQQDMSNMGLLSGGLGDVFNAVGGPLLASAFPSIFGKKPATSGGT
ncbi:MAG TPA: hypothetical protein VJQ59_16740 [Candidatus Sulfotelmatobacter sp.]|nr:hypothetical protein [Candidatus Sulfotelmatobacter sp.]